MKALKIYCSIDTKSAERMKNLCAERHFHFRKYMTTLKGRSKNPRGVIFWPGRIKPIYKNCITFLKNALCLYVEYDGEKKCIKTEYISVNDGQHEFFRSLLSYMGLNKPKKPFQATVHLCPDVGFKLKIPAIFFY